VKKVRVVPNAMGPSFMIPFEICYQTDMSSSVISFPDTYRLTPKHHQLMVATRPRKAIGRLHRRIFYCSYIATCHEVIHTFQPLWGQKDNSLLSWSNEFDASFPCNSLLWQICSPSSSSSSSFSSTSSSSSSSSFDIGKIQEIMKDIVWEGLREELMLELFDTGLRAYRSWKPPVLKQYCRWRDNFGLIPPDAWVNKDANLVSEFKEVVSLDCFYSDFSSLQAQLNLIFRERRGDVHFFVMHGKSTMEKQILSNGGSPEMRKLFSATSKTNDEYKKNRV